jgi:hypothetical protein
MLLEFQNNHIPDKLYLTKKLEPKTMQKVLGSTAFTVDRLYHIVNDQLTKIDLVDQRIDGTLFRIYVRMHYAYAGEARIQVNNIKPWKSLLRKKPYWTLRAIVETQDHNVIYTFEHKYTNINHLHRDIMDQYEHLHAFIIRLKQN